ncbi:MAG: heparan-alpha-glucosaminide N-acetyltransferase domain-containing protein [Candidatus Peribacteraceae bacterium]|nr:heparan-alpha-glucosaminide N-acetyltransferase domain-containing protein [Candidatus Peribacteraceae bacterium]
MIDLIPTAFAETVTYTDLTQLNLFDVIYLFAALAILGAGALSIVFIFFGGFSFILSGGDEAKVKQAIHTIRYAIIGLIISLLSLVFVPLIGKLFGVNFNFLDFETLSNRINILFEQFRSDTPAPATSFEAEGGASTTATPDVSLDELIK